VSWHTLSHWLYLARYQWFMDHFPKIVEQRLTSVVRSEELHIDSGKIVPSASTVSIHTE